MKHEILTAETSREQITIFCKFAEEHKADFKLPKLKKFLNMDFAKFCAFLRSRYLLEKGEQILRPLFFYEIGGDCDDATIFTVAAWLQAGISKQCIRIVEARENENSDFCHIFCALYSGETKSFLWFDNLPDTEFNRLDYGREQIRITRLTDYI